MAEEKWAGIREFPGYAVSNLGRVKNTRTHTVLTPRDNSYGYSRVALRKDGKTHEVYVHKLVAQAFISGWKPGIRIRHQHDNNDNRVRNLRFSQGVRMGALVREPRKAISRRIRIVETGDSFASIEALARYIEGDVSSIYRVLRGDRSSHKGLTFEYHYEEHN